MKLAAKKKPRSRRKKVNPILWNGKASSLSIELDREIDGRWIAEISALPGVMAYGDTRAEAINLVKALALRVIADRLEHGEPMPDLGNVFSVVA